LTAISLTFLPLTREVYSKPLDEESKTKRRRSSFKEGRGCAKITLMSLEPIVSIIVPVYNSEKYLRAALDSYLGQDFARPYEVLIALDPSADHSGEIAHEYEGKHPNLRVLESPVRRGLERSCYEGVLGAKGKYVFCGDADDLMAPDGLRTLVEEAERSGADIVNASFCVMSEEGKKRQKNPFVEKAILDKKEAVGHFLEDKTLRGFYWTKLIRRSLFDRRPLLLLSEKGAIFEELPLNFSLICLADKVSLIKKPVYFYRKGNANSVTTAKRLDRAKWHLIVMALERIYLERLGDPELLKVFHHHLHRQWLSLLFDLHKDKKSGAEAKAERRLIKQEFAFLKKDEKLPLEGRVWSDYIERSFIS
jgi:glycosyltransferase involved in cell wall biosynthesis